jgi:hypothetical protein
MACATTWIAHAATAVKNMDAELSSIKSIDNIGKWIVRGSESLELQNREESPEYTRKK